LELVVRLGDALIAGRLGDLSYRVRLSNCRHSVYSLGFGVCYLFCRRDLNDESALHETGVTTQVKGFLAPWNSTMRKITGLQNVRPTAENRVLGSSKSVLIHCTLEIPDNGRPRQNEMECPVGKF
jgi:hypothetical protein